MLLKPKNIYAFHPSITEAKSQLTKRPSSVSIYLIYSNLFSVISHSNKLFSAHSS